MHKYLEAISDGLQMGTARPWTVIKLDYLTRYIDAFETSMYKKWEIRNYIDLMAGSGKNAVYQSNVFLGSPLIALTTTHPFTGYYFVEKNKKKIKALQERCASSPSFQNVSIKLGDCNVIIDEIISQLKKMKGIR